MTRVLALAIATFLLAACTTSTTYKVMNCPAPLTMSACAERMGMGR